MLSVVVSWLVVGPPTAITVWQPVYRGRPCRDPPVCHRVQSDTVGKRQRLLCAGWSRDVVRTMRSRSTCIKECVSRSCAPENTYTPARLEALVKLSVVTILSDSYDFTKCSAGCGCSFQLVILLKISSKFSYLSNAVSQSVFFTQMLICFSLEIDHFRMLSRLSMDFTVIFATACFPSSALSIFNCCQSVRSQRGRLCLFPRETSVICSVVCSTSLTLFAEGY